MKLFFVLKHGFVILLTRTLRTPLEDPSLNQTPLITRFFLNLSLFMALFTTALTPALAIEQVNHTLSASKTTKEQPVCVHIASYAPGYAWQDGVDRGIQQQLKNKCRLKTFYMNSKKIKNDVKLADVGLLAKNFIEESQPDVVIVSDDNAVKYVLQPYFKNHKLPFVFCAINNTAKHYGLPYQNTTGMIEIAPTKFLLQQILSMGSGHLHVAYLTTLGNTANNNIADFHKIINQLNLKSSAYQAHNQKQWRSLYRQLQEDPDVSIIILGNYVAFPHWNAETNLQWVKKYNQKITLAAQPWMMPYVAFGMTKSPDEQGQWAALTALEILQGTPIELLEIIPNQQVQTWINKQLIKPVEHLIPPQLLSQAVVYQENSQP